MLFKLLDTHTLILSALEHFLITTQPKQIYVDLYHTQKASAQHSFQRHHSLDYRIQEESLRILVLFPREL